MSDGHTAKDGYVDPSYPSPGGPNDATVIIYGYIPALALCVLGIVLFGISLVLHAGLLLRHRLWSFSPLALGCTLEVVGYVARTLSSQQNPYNIIYFVVQYFMIVTAPVFISASIYVCLSKLIGWANTYASPSRKHPQSASTSQSRSRLPAWLFSPRGILYLFITIDILSTITQVAGAALIGSYESDGKDPKKPNDILLAGLAIQTASFTVFLTLLVLFRYAIATTNPSSTDGPTASRQPHTKKDPFILALFVASLLIYLRTIFRLAETSQGVFGYLSTHEAFFGALEFAPVVVAVWVLAIWHPGRWVGRKAVTEAEAGAEMGAVHGSETERGLGVREVESSGERSDGVVAGKRV